MDLKDQLTTTCFSEARQTTWRVIAEKRLPSSNNDSTHRTLEMGIGFGSMPPGPESMVDHGVNHIFSATSVKENFRHNHERKKVIDA